MPTIGEPIRATAQMESSVIKWTRYGIHPSTSSGPNQLHVCIWRSKSDQTKLWDVTNQHCITQTTSNPISQISIFQLQSPIINEIGWQCTVTCQPYQIWEYSTTPPWRRWCHPTPSHTPTSTNGKKDEWSMVQVRLEPIEAHLNRIEPIRWEKQRVKMNHKCGCLGEWVYVWWWLTDER